MLDQLGDASELEKEEGFRTECLDLTSVELAEARRPILNELRIYKNKELAIGSNIYKLLEELESENELPLKKRESLMKLYSSIQSSATFLDKCVGHQVYTIRHGHLVMAKDSQDRVIGYNYCAIKSGQVFDSYTGVSILHRRRGIGSKMMRLRHQYLVTQGIRQYNAILVGAEPIFRSLNIHIEHTPDKENINKYVISL